MTRNALLLLAALGLLVPSICGCGAKVSKRNYDKIENGMTQAQVESILGKGKEASSGVSIPGVSVGDLHVSGVNAGVKMLVWEDGDRKIAVAFANGKVISKTQSGF